MPLFTYITKRPGVAAVPIVSQTKLKKLHYEMYVRHKNSGVFDPFDLISETVKDCGKVYGPGLSCIKCVSFSLKACSIHFSLRKIFSEL
jgi:hypothetical protein